MSKINLDFALICEYASTDASNKLSMMGNFNEVYGPSFPVVNNNFSLVVVWEGEAGAHKQLIKVIDEAGKSLGKPGLDWITFKLEKDKFQQIVNFPTGVLKFEKAGTYTIQIFLDNENNLIKEIKLNAKQEGN